MIKLPLFTTTLRFPDCTCIRADVMDYDRDQVLCRYTLPRGLVTLAWLPQDFLKPAKQRVSRYILSENERL